MLFEVQKVLIYTNWQQYSSHCLHSQPHLMVSGRVSYHSSANFMKTWSGKKDVLVNFQERKLCFFKAQ